MEYLAVSRVNSSETCFVHFSEALFKFWENEIKSFHNLLKSSRVSVPLLIKCGGGEFVTSWSGRCIASGGQHVVYINRGFAKHYGIEEESAVHIKFISTHIPAANQVTVSPCRKTDWDILALNSCRIENILLNQISLVRSGDVFPLHLSPSTVVYLKIISTNPDGIVHLQEFAEVIVAPFEEPCPKNGLQSHQHFDVDGKYLDREYTYLYREPSICNNSDNFVISKVIKCISSVIGSTKCSDIHLKSDVNDSCNQLSSSDTSKSNSGKWMMHMQPLPSKFSQERNCDITNDIDKKCTVSMVTNTNLPPYQGFVCENVFNNGNSHCNDSTVYFQVAVETDHEGTGDNKKTTANEDEEVKIMLQVKILPLTVWNEFFDLADTGIIYVNPLVTEQLQVKAGTKVLIQYYEGSIDTIQGIVLHCQSSHGMLNEKLKEVFRSSLKVWIDLADTVIINQGTLFTFQVDLDHKHAVTELIGVTRDVCGKISRKTFDDLFVYVEDDETHDITQSKSAEKTSFNFYKFTNDIIEHLKLGFWSMKECNTRTSLVNYQPIVLLHGKSLATSNGCGKTLIARTIADHFTSHPYFCHVEYIDCISMKGKTVTSILKQWEEAFEVALLHEPSIVIIDDLDELISNIDVLQDGFTKNKYSERLGDLFRSLIEAIFNGNRRVFIIVTITTLESLHPCILPELNTHLFTKYVCLSNLHFNQIDMLDWFIKDNTEKQCNGFKSTTDLIGSKELTRKLASYNLKNFSSIVTRTLGSKYKHVIDEDPSSTVNILDLNVTSLDIESNLETFDKILMNDLNIHKPKSVTWEDIGGLKSVKEKLKEALLWPAMYPELLSQCPLRLCSGVLLYGAPGTAKTMLASAIAHESDLNFINVKGPELLSKYVGSSESNVRDLFARAETAKPCIVFFDELESIAPRRGHDNTGVTDRVVNQLLTQLDGVESLDGVFVLAASSRPDLVDPALLRPGRFDKSILCPMPTGEEREEILNILVKEISVCPSIDLKVLSARTNGFSGADLKALVFNAQVECAHGYLKSLKNDSTENHSKLEDCILVSMEHFTRALECTQPSVSTEEKTRYLQIFEKFTSQSTVHEASQRIQKVTLA